MGSALRAQGALEPDGEPLRRAIGQGARGAKRRPSTGTLPGPPWIRIPGPVAPGLAQRRAEPGAAVAESRGPPTRLAGASCRCQAPTPAGESRFKASAGHPRSVLRRLAWSFVEMIFFKCGESPSPGTLLIRPPHNPCSLLTDLQIGGLSWALPRNGLSANSTVIALNQPSLGAHFSFQECFWGVGEDAYRRGGDVWQTRHIRFN